MAEAGEKLKADVNEVLAEFDSKKDSLVAIGERTKTLLVEILQDAKIQFQSIQARVKSREKLREKYLDGKKDYKRLGDITDQVALRIITYYEDEVDRVAEIIKREFQIDPANSVDKRETEPDKFGYYALNYVCCYSRQRTVHVEYRRYSGVWFEIQIVSILRHAWSEIEHPWYDLKDHFPDNIKRRFARMAALLEIAESEFLSLRKLQSDYTRSIAVQVQANVYNIPVDAVSLRSFIEQEPLVAQVDATLGRLLGLDISQELPDSLVERRVIALKGAGIGTLQEVRDLLQKYEFAVPEYLRRCWDEHLWAAAASGPLPRSLSLYHLGGFVSSTRGVPAVGKFWSDLEVKVSFDLARQVAIAQDVAARFSRERA